MHFVHLRCIRGADLYRCFPPSVQAENSKHPARFKLRLLDSQTCLQRRAKEKSKSNDQAAPLSSSKETPAAAATLLPSCLLPFTPHPLPHSPHQDTASPTLRSGQVFGNKNFHPALDCRLQPGTSVDALSPTLESLLYKFRKANSEQARNRFRCF